MAGPLHSKMHEKKGKEKKEHEKKPGTLKGLGHAITGALSKGIRGMPHVEKKAKNKHIEEKDKKKFFSGALPGGRKANISIGHLGRRPTFKD